MDSELAQVYQRLHQRELEARETIFAEFPTLTLEELAARRDHASGPSTVEQWRPERRIFAFAHGGKDRFPDFQFDEAGPKPIVEEVLKALTSPCDREYQEPPFSDWAVMFWFAAANAWLEGRRPVDLVNTRPEYVLNAASHARDQIA